MTRCRADAATRLNVWPQGTSAKGSGNSLLASFSVSEIGCFIISPTGVDLGHLKVEKNVYSGIKSR